MGTSVGTQRASAQTKKALAALALLVAICLFDPTSAFAAASYVFEPTLSLTGNCKTSALDEVPDPGLCPIPPGTVYPEPGADHPSAGFQSPNVTTDAYGDIYVANMVEGSGRIDIFNAEGLFIGEVPDTAGPQSIAVDLEGNLYVFERLAGGERQIRRFPPTAYEPLKGKIEYGAAPVLVANESTKELIHLGVKTSLAIEPVSQRLYVDNVFAVAVLGSATESNALLDSEIIDIPNHFSASIAIDAKHGKIYVSDGITGSSIIRIFELASPYEELGQINGSTTPKGEFLVKEGGLAVDVDEDLGHVFVGDFTAQKVYEFEADGTYLASLEHSFTGVTFGEIAVDDGPFSPRPQTEGWLFVPSNPAPSLGHVYAFEPKEQCPPKLESTSVTGITKTEAALHAQVNPCGLPTEYRLEYIAQQQFEEEGNSFANATVAGEGTLPKGAEGVAVAAAATGLEPGTTYIFRAFAENEEGTGEQQNTFMTFEEVEPPPACPNDTFRTGPSALLPDCRAYELVTPPDTNGRAPSAGVGGVFFPTLEAAPDGNRFSFEIGGGSLPGSEGTGVIDTYLSTRGSEGWASQLAGPSGEEAPFVFPGSVSPDQTYSLWESDAGTHLHYPDGHSELVGQGSLGADPKVEANLVTEGATHIIFMTRPSIAVKLEPNAAPPGTSTVYDRSSEGPTHVVSLLPGDEPQKAGEDALYLGASEDGEGIAFEIGGTIYVRLHNTETLKVAGPGSAFAGISEEGKRVFYMEGGDLFAFDTEAAAAIPFSETGDVTPVNVATGGTRAYFISPSVLTGEANPSGEEAKNGEENLYLSEEGAISFVGIVTERDVEGEGTISGQIGGLGLWLEALDFPAVDPSRTTPSGATLLFESRANLTGFDSEGFAQVYRYDATEGRLDCLSCSPTGTSPTGDASLQSVGPVGQTFLKIRNQSPNGKRAFYQTVAALVVGDTDGVLDVYEWEEKGVGSCGKDGGCVYLISGGHSASPDYLYAMSASGDDVFFGTTDLLLPRDAESTLSFYDARVYGGFPEPAGCQEGCCGESCQPLGQAPQLPKPATSVVGGSGDVPAGRPCPKGKHKAKRHGRTVCVKKHKPKHRHIAGSKKKGGA